MALTYHRVTAAPHGRPLIESASAQALVEERERALGIRFPASVREWSSLGEAMALLPGYRTMDHPVLPGELGAVVRDWHGTGPQDPVATRLLVCLSENQHVAQCAARLATSSGLSRPFGDAGAEVGMNAPKGPMYRLFAG